MRKLVLFFLALAPISPLVSFFQAITQLFGVPRTNLQLQRTTMASQLLGMESFREFQSFSIDNSILVAADGGSQTHVVCQWLILIVTFNSIFYVYFNFRRAFYRESTLLQMCCIHLCNLEMKLHWLSFQRKPKSLCGKSSSSSCKLSLISFSLKI